MLPDRQEELNEFKTTISLPVYIEARGYERDARLSTSRYHVLRHPNGEKLNVTQGSNGHWKYVNVHDATDSGTIVDFIQRRDKCSLGEVRKLLRHWSSRGFQPAPDAISARLPLFEHDASRALVAWHSALPIDGIHAYLERERCIARGVLHDPIFQGRIRRDRRWNNALFAHHDKQGLCGFEIKNSGVTMFSPGGTRGLFTSRAREGDRVLIVSETAVDSLSFAALFGTERKRFVSTGGQISARQRDLLQSAAAKLPPDGKVVLALDNDHGGERLGQAIQEALEAIDFPREAIESAIPESAGDDWNDVLKRTAQSSLANLTPECARS